MFYYTIQFNGIVVISNSGLKFKYADILVNVLPYAANQLEKYLVP